MWQQSWQTWKVQVSYNKGGGTGLAPEPPFPMGYIQNSWVALYCRCPSVSWRCHLAGVCQVVLQVSFCQLELPVNHDPDTLNFLELLAGCCPGCDVIQIHLLDETYHPDLPTDSGHPGRHPGWLTICSNEFLWGPFHILLTWPIFHANFPGLAHIIY